MSALNKGFWLRRRERKNASHYENIWLDTYAFIVRLAGMKRVWPKGVESVLDVGCGDGRFGKMVKRKFGVSSMEGIDFLEFPDTLPRLDAFWLNSIEDMAEVLEEEGWPEYDLVLFATSLTFMEDPRSALEAAHKLAEYVLIVENTQQPTPPWMENLGYRKHLPFTELFHLMNSIGFVLKEGESVNVLDRRLFLKLWNPIAFLLTLPIDLLVARFTLLYNARYTALLFQRVAGGATP